MTDTTTDPEVEETEEPTPELEPEVEETEEPEGEEPDTFPRSVVEDLRKENATYRARSKDRDDLARRLHTALTAATGRLADPSDLAFDEAHLADQDALTTALDTLLASKPHLAARRPRGDIGQGVSGTTATVDLAGILRSRA